MLRLATAALLLYAIAASATHTQPRRTAIVVYDEGHKPDGVVRWLKRPASEVSVRRVVPAGAWASGAAEGALALVDAESDGIEYDHAVLCVRSLPAGLAPAEVVAYAQRGGTLLWIVPGGSEPLSKETRLLLRDLGFSLSTVPPLIQDVSSGSDTPLESDNNSASSNGQHANTGTDATPQDKNTLVKSPVGSQIVSSSFVLEMVGPGHMVADAPPAAFVGAAHAIVASNPLVFPVATARESARAVCAPGAPGECRPQTGTDAVAASALQARGGPDAARILLFTAHPPSFFGGEAPASLLPLLAWATRQAGVVRLASVSHWRIKDDTDRHYARRSDLSAAARPQGMATYRVGDAIGVRVCLEEKRAAGEPFAQATPAGVQAELALLEPALRVTLRPDAHGCLVSGAVQLPGTPGVYTLSVRHDRAGWPHVRHEEKVAVRPLHADEHPRLWLRALPFYVGWASQLAAALLFLVPALLYGDPLDNSHLKAE